MWDLEYLLLFGIPNNKIELLDGRSRWAFPFTSRELASPACLPGSSVSLRHPIGREKSGLALVNW
jgi:hypothetical protein